MFLAAAVKLNQKYQIKAPYVYIHCSSLLYLRLDATFYFVEIEINALIELSFYRLLFVSSRHGRSTLRSAPDSPEALCCYQHVQTTVQSIDVLLMLTLQV